MTSKVITTQIRLALCLVTFVWVCRLWAVADYTQVITNHATASEMPQTAVMNDFVILNQTLLHKTNTKAKTCVQPPDRAFLLENWNRSVCKIFVWIFDSYTIMLSLSKYQLWVPELAGNYMLWGSPCLHEYSTAALCPPAFWLYA